MYNPLSHDTGRLCILYIGVDIGGTKCAVVRGDADGTVQNKIRFATTSVEETLAAIEQAVADIGDGEAIGISCGGPLDSERGLILSPPNLPGWDEIPIVERLHKRFGVPVALQNDANACALAEWKFGAGRGTKNMIFLTFGTGLGAGLILNGQLYSGTNDMAGEVGHIRLCDHGPVGYGKSGSFEGFCSGGGIAELAQTVARERLQVGKTTGFCRSYDEMGSITAKSVADCAKAGDPDALRVYDICADMLGRGVSVLVDVLNPECIVIGSVFARCEELLRPGMERVLERESLAYARGVCRVVPAALGESIGDVAALAVAANAVS